MEIEKPPMLSEGTIAGIFYSTASKPRKMQMALFEGIAQAQRDADVIWFKDWLKQEDYVRLSHDQRLPPTPKDYPTMNLYTYGLELKEAGWRKVQLG